MLFNFVIGEKKNKKPPLNPYHPITFHWMLSSLPNGFWKTTVSITSFISAFLHILKLFSTLFSLCTAFDNQWHHAGYRHFVTGMHNMNALLTCQITENALKPGSCFLWNHRLLIFKASTAVLWVIRMGNLSRHNSFNSQGKIRKLADITLISQFTFWN